MLRKAHLDLNRPREVADVDKERYVRAVAEIKVLVGEAVLELFDVAPWDDWNLLSGLGTCLKIEWIKKGSVIVEEGDIITEKKVVFPIKKGLERKDVEVWIGLRLV